MKRPENGPNAIEGQAFLRQRGGGVVTCAGEPVTLIPVSDHAIDRFRQIYGSAQGGIVRVPISLDVESNRDSVYDSFTRHTECDAEGDFEFGGLADGEYFVTTGVYWETAGGLEGGSLASRVRVEGGETARVLLN